ncbi:ABC transporter permease [Paenibacillus chungangensis]|uniref:ABC transporter permease n=1 Tax=Paenibacillus chungangensis TaxID=696535 RepID=A0ABW3HQE9_9BACL
MLHLIKLELKKGKMISYVWGSLIAYASIAAFFFLMYFVEAPSEDEPVFTGYGDMFSLIDTIGRATFIVYASVMLSKLIISEFRDKTMTLMFAYPISRKKIIFAKLAMVFSWTFVNLIILNVVLGALVVAVNTYVGYVDDAVTTELLQKQGLNVLMQSFGAAGMSLMPLAFGMRSKSVATTVVSSILIVAIVVSNSNGFSLSHIIAVPLSLGILGILLTYLSFRKVDDVDM